MIAQCPSVDELEAFARAAADPGLSSTDHPRVLAHLRLCAQCAAAVDALREDNRLLGEAAAAAGTHRSHAEASEDAGARAGFVPPPAYAIVHELGRGGQGVVYLARHLPTRRNVAIKVLGAGGFAASRRRARFEREVELAAGLRHPGIVTLHDSGVSENGHPFLVMEYVAGVPLDEFAARVRSGPSEAARRELLGLFVKIGKAVAHAHARGIIHRDLKPANILVERAGAQGSCADATREPEPRILDFGLAKAIAGDAATDGRSVVGTGAWATMTGTFAGTLAYAAPETLRNGIDAADVRADVYALGVILYEMLTGRRPHDDQVSVAEMVRRMTETGPRPASDVDGSLSADLDTVLMRSLSIDPDRRYQATEALVRDVERVIAGEPIEARRDGALYQLRRRARRHRVALAAALAGVMVLGGFTAALSVMYRHAMAARAEAEARRTQAELQTRRAERLLSISLGALAGEMDTAERRLSLADVAEQATARAETELADEPAARARLFQSLAELQLRAGNAAQSDRLSRLALQDLERSVGTQSDEYLRALDARALLRRQAGDSAGAERAASDALELARSLHGPASVAAANALNRLSQVSRAGPKRTEGLLRESVRILESLPDAPPDDLGRALENLGAICLHTGQVIEAERHLRRALELRAAAMGPLHPRLFPLRGGIARSLVEQGRDAEAAAILEELYRGRSANRGGRQTAIVQTTRRMLAEAWVRMDRLDDALALWNDIPGRPGPEAAGVVARELLRQRGREAEAEALLAAAIGDITPDTLVSGNGVEPAISALALCRARAGDHREARALAEHAHQQLARERDRRRTRDYTQVRIADALGVLVEVCELAGDQQAAAGYQARLRAQPARSRADLSGLEP